jgi:hypothetical protein
VPNKDDRRAALLVAVEAAAVGDKGLPITSAIVAAFRGAGISALQAANDSGDDVIETLDRAVGWHRLLRMKPELAALVEDNEASPLVLAAEQYSTVSKYAGAFPQSFIFRSARKHDPLLAAITVLKRLHLEAADTPRSCPDHSSQCSRKETHL